MPPRRLLSRAVWQKESQLLRIFVKMETACAVAVDFLTLFLWLT